METRFFDYKYTFALESGAALPGFRLAYTTRGTLNSDRSNVVWVCHALTGSADPGDWWDGMIGPGKFYDPAHQFIICANVLGSCYGSTGPLSINPLTGQPFYHEFPLVTIHDIVRALDLLRQELGIEKIHTCIGGSLGGQQALEWAIQQPDVIQNLILIATNAVMSPWGIAFNESQRMAIGADPTWAESRDDAGRNGMKAARAMAMISYRNYDTYGFTQALDNNEQLDHYKASSYQQYQGEKLASRFNAYTYWILSKVMDSHNVGRNRGSISRALEQVVARTLSVGIKSDILFPPVEQKALARLIPDARYEEIDSLYGHDGFLIETKPLTQLIRNWLEEQKALINSEIK
ncbi:homoserine O-acetyltransferase MetX [Larkinella arboricola]